MAQTNQTTHFCVRRLAVLNCFSDQKLAKKMNFKKIVPDLPLSIPVALHISASPAHLCCHNRTSVPSLSEQTEQLCNDGLNPSPENLLYLPHFSLPNSCPTMGLNPSSYSDAHITYRQIYLPFLGRSSCLLSTARGQTHPADLGTWEQHRWAVSPIFSPH